MKAVISARYGPPEVLEIRDVPRPEAGAQEVLVRVCATTVSRTDCGWQFARPFLVRFIHPPASLLRPKFATLGMDFAGVVESVGAGVAAFTPGDRVFGMSAQTYGVHAEYLRVPDQGTIGLMPEGLGFDEAVVCEGAWYALISLQALGLKAGQRILIYGASGAIGTAAVQLAKAMGATVTAVVATRHIELARSLGADRVVDYTAEDFTSIGETFDCVLDAVGKIAYFRCRRLLKASGVFVSTDAGPWGQNALLAAWSLITRNGRIGMAIPRNAKASFEFIRERMAAKNLRAVIDRTYPLEAIADAYRYVETGQKTGIVVIRVGSGDEKTNP